MVLDFLHGGEDLTDIQSHKTTSCRSPNLINATDYFIFERIDVSRNKMWSGEEAEATLWFP